LDSTLPAATSDSTEPLRRTVRDELSDQRLIIFMMFGVIFFEWPFAAASRIIGFYTNSDFLLNNDIGDGFALLLSFFAAITGLYASARRGMSASVIVATMCVVGIFLIQLVSAALNPVELGAWGNPQDEFLRSVTLLGQLLAFTCLPLNFNQVTPRYIRSYWGLYVSFMLIGLIVTILQSIGTLPNFYFQWFGSQRLPRPAGGLAHPHYYAVITSLTLFILVLLRRDNRISVGWSLILTMATILAVILSTSRVGFIVLAIGLVRSGRDLTQLNWSDYLVSLILGTMVAVAVVALSIFAGVKISGLENLWDIFFSFVGDDKVDVFRGRGTSWSVEIDYISKDVMHFLFGYGYQPFVSHNLILRQMQVTGFFGALFYIILLTLTFRHALTSTMFGYKKLIATIIIQVIVASSMFPVMVSQLTLAAILVVLAFVSLGSRGFFEGGVMPLPIRQPGALRYRGGDSRHL